MNRLVDPAGRTIRKLRVSLTDACNQACTYCMPDKPRFTSRGNLLRPSEYLSICRRLAAMGIEEIRVTGGEPTVRPEFRHILAALKDLPVLRKGVTSNGEMLGGHLEFLRDTGWTHLNISLDSLDPGVYERITGGGDFRKVMRTIEKAAGMGFPVKVNMVVLKGVNDAELVEFADWSATVGVEVRFLELMKIGPSAASHSRRFMPASAMIEALGKSIDLRPLPRPFDATAISYATGKGGRIGIIASESMPFCAGCSRLRLSATGFLRACLMSEAGADLRSADAEEYPRLVEDVMALKPTGRLDRLLEPMHAVGG